MKNKDNIDSLKKIGKIDFKDTKDIVYVDTLFKHVGKSLDEAGDESLVIEGYANTTAKDRAGDVILGSAWSGEALQNYMKNPIILAYHDHSMPIGTAIEVTPNEGGLYIKATISKYAGDVYGLIKDGVLKAFSIGFRIKDAYWEDKTDTFVITDLELLENSVVSVPCNQDSTFSVSKGMEATGNYESFKKQFQKTAVNAAAKSPNIDNEEPNKMSDNLNIDELMAKMFEASKQATKDALAAEAAEKAAAEKAAAEKAAAEKAMRDNIKATAKEEAKTLIKEMEDALEASEAKFNEYVSNNNELIKALKSEIAQVVNSRNNKFALDPVASAVKGEQSNEDAEKAVMLALAMTTKDNQVGVFDTEFGKSLKAVNTSSSIEVSSEAYETTFLANLIRDIELKLILKPMFSEVAMNSANMTVPVRPESAEASWVAASSFGQTGSTGAEVNTALTEVTLTTHKLAGKVFLTDETEEDTVLAMLPILRDRLVEAHANAIDKAILRGTGVNQPKGLLTFATDDSRTFATAAKADGSVKVTAAMINEQRRKLGIRGLELEDLVVLVSMDAYYDLLEDPEWQDVNVVGAANATKLTGQVGRIHGMPVVVAKHFEAVGASKAFGAIVHTPTFVVPRQRQATVETDYLVEQQTRLIVATQRLNFQRYFDGEGVVSMTYAA